MGETGRPSGAVSGAPGAIPVGRTSGGVPLVGYPRVAGLPPVSVARLPPLAWRRA